jgi:membrane associated rhomboid family serine protease
MIPLSVDVPMKRMLWANWALIVVTVALSLAVPYAPKERFALDPAGHTRDELSPLVLQRHGFAVYQLVTCLFQHAGLVHLFGNMVFLFVFGNAINAKLGHLGFLAAYLGLGLLLGAGEACLGASAAIMGLCGMFLVLYPRNGVTVYWDEFEVAWFTRQWSGEIPGWATVLLFLAFDVCGAIFDPDSPIGHMGHIVGGLTGMGLAVALLKGDWLTADRGEQTLLMWLAGKSRSNTTPGVGRRGGRNRVILRWKNKRRKMAVPGWNDP